MAASQPFAAESSAREPEEAVKRFVDVGNWADAQLTAADQARFFLRVDLLVPAAHRRYARDLLSSIVGWQRWGIAPVARAHGMKIFFKGGWRTGIVHQVALLERDGRRIALAVLTAASPRWPTARRPSRALRAASWAERRHGVACWSRQPVDDPDPEARGDAEPEDPPAPGAGPPGKPLAALTPLFGAVAGLGASGNT
jgi:hypothetical protein